MLVVVFIILLFLIGIGLLAIGNVHSIDDPNRTISLRPWSLIPFALAFLLLLVTSFTIVSPGNVGVPVAFGNAGAAVGAGFHVKAPWANIHKVNVRVQNYTMTATQAEGSKAGDDSVPVHTKDQAVVGVDSTALFRLTEGKARDVYVNVGGDYINTIVRPTIRSAIRDAATPYDAVDLATDKRAAFQAAAKSQIEEQLARYGIQVVDLQIRDLHLDANIQRSVNAKVSAQQDAAAQQFVLQKVKQQAQQRITEAEGLARSQQIIHSTLTPEYLQYQYIKTLEDLANSKNSTFLFLPSDPSALPQFQVPLKVSK